MNIMRIEEGRQEPAPEAEAQEVLEALLVHASAEVKADLLSKKQPMLLLDPDQILVGEADPYLTQWGWRADADRFTPVLTLAYSLPRSLLKTQ